MSEPFNTLVYELLYNTVPARTMTTKKERDSSFRVELSYSTVIQKTLHTSQRPHCELY